MVKWFCWALPGSLEKMACTVLSCVPPAPHHFLPYLLHCCVPWRSKWHPLAFLIQNGACLSSTRRMDCSLLEISMCEESPHAQDLTMRLSTFAVQTIFTLKVPQFPTTNHINLPTVLNPFMNYVNYVMWFKGKGDSSCGTIPGLSGLLFIWLFSGLTYQPSSHLIFSSSPSLKNV